MWWSQCEIANNRPNAPRTHPRGRTSTTAAALRPTLFERTHRQRRQETLVAEAKGATAPSRRLSSRRRKTSRRPRREASCYDQLGVMNRAIFAAGWRNTTKTLTTPHAKWSHRNIRRMRSKVPVTNGTAGEATPLSAVILRLGYEPRKGARIARLSHDMIASFTTDASGEHL
jgi:hypothetical protein